MAEVTNRRVNIFIETGEAQRAFDKLNAKAEALQKEIAQTSDKGKLRQLKKELDTLQEPLQRAAQKAGGQLAPSLKELQKLTNDLGNRMRRMSTTDADFSKVLEQYSRAKAELSQVRAEVRKVEDAHNKVKEGGGFMQSFFGNLAANAVSQIGGFVKQQITQAVTWALEVEGVRRAYDRLNQPQLLDNLRRATAGTVSDLELMKRAVAAKNFQIPLETLGTLMEFAKRRANETGQSVDYLVDSIVTGIGRKSPLILDNLGINAARLSAEFQRTGDFAKATANIVDEELEKMGTAVITNGDKVDQWKTRWVNAWTDIGSGVIGVGNWIEDRFTQMFDLAAFAAEKGAQKIAKENEANYQFELQMIETYQSRFAGADKAGRDQIIRQVEAEITTTKAMRDKAFADGLTDQGNQFSRYLDAWGRFLGEIKQAAGNTDTLAGINKEIQLLTEQLNNTALGSAKFKEIDAQIKALEKKRDDATGKTAQEAERKAQAAADKAKNKREQDGRKIVEDQKKLGEELKKLRTELSLFDEGEQNREVQRVLDKYQNLRRLAHGNHAQLKELEELFQQEINQITVKYARKNLEAWEKLTEDQKKQREQSIQNSLQSAQGFLGRLNENINQVQGRNNRSAVAALELEVLQKNGRARLDAQKRLLEEQMRQELQNTDLTEAEKELIREQYRQRGLELERTHWQNVAALILEFVGQALQVLDQFSQMQTERENQALERDRVANERKKSNWDRQLKNKTITQQDYDRRVAEMEAAQEKKERAAELKQFKRGQRMAVANALISGAQGASKTIAEWGMPLAIPWLALVAASVVAQIATINAQKPPEMARGGLLHGPSHKSRHRGMPVTNPETGTIQAFLEGGEAIVNKRSMADNRRYTMTGTTSQIISTLNGLHGGVEWTTPAVLIPRWRTTTPKTFDFGAISRSYQTVRMFEQGGTWGTPPTTEASTASDTAAVLLQATQVMAQLHGAIAAGIHARVVLSDLEGAQDRKQSIVRDATMQG